MATRGSDTSRQTFSANRIVVLLSLFALICIPRSAIAALPTAADNTVTTNEDTAHTFTAAEFNYCDGDYESALTFSIDVQPSHEIVFIDTRVADYQLLVDDLKSQAGGERQIEALPLDAGHDGIQQICNALSARQNIDAVHIFSHGIDGAVELGNTWLNTFALETRADAIAQWRTALSPDADILLYGCNVAADAQGQPFIDQLSKLTGADMAASDDNTGHAIFGADWDLEYTAGQIETKLVFSQELYQNWGHLLNVAVDATSTGTIAKGNSSDTISHTTSGSERLMLVGISFGEDKDDVVSSVTYNGTNLILVGARDNSDTATARVEIWALVAPATGTHNVVVNTSGTDHEGATIGVMTFTGANQSTAVGSFASAEGDSDSPSTTVSSAADEIVFGVVAYDDSSNRSFTPGAGQTERWELFTDKANGAGSTEAGAASVVTSWSVSTGGKWVAGGVSIKLPNQPPTGSNISVVTNEDTAHTFAAPDFSYSDGDGDPMASVKITSLESVGALQLSGADVTLNQVITKADIDANNFKFVPADHGNGDGYDSFEFSVNDGT
ncbi:MAG: DUF4347 domain-containing protein, partial [Gammaproteobacteria bacterium]|nr:DUF4347 domain-containing protein [Gammaproteobacteria bacterium]